MMWLNDRFDVFDSRISLNDDRTAKIRSAYDNLVSFVKSDPPLAAAYLDLFIQGSFAIGTAIRPPEEGVEFDLDCVLVLDLSKRPFDKRTPVEVIRWIATRLRQNRHYEGKVHERTRCVRIVYTGDFHVDVVPARLTGALTDVLEIPSKTDGWRATHPRGFAAWVKAIDKQSNGRFTQVVREGKYWRDLRFGQESKPKSILLTTLLGNSYSDVDGSVSESFVLTLERLRDELAASIFLPTVQNPALPGEDLARDWDDDAFDLFQQRLSSAAKTARKGLDLAESDREKSLTEWLYLFGERFPKLGTNDGAKYREAVSAGTLAVTGSGRITVTPTQDRTVAVPQHRFYGRADS